MPELDIRPIDPGDLDQVAKLASHSFGGPQTVSENQPPAVPFEDTVAAYQGRRLVATVVVHRFQQVFGGEQVPCAGIGSVMVAPDHRGHGLARRLMSVATDRGREWGLAVSALYPTTAPLYRSIGYEVAGGWTRSLVDIADLPTPTGEVTWEPADPGEPMLAALHAQTAEARDGWVLPPDPWWKWWAAQAEEPQRAWTWLGRRGSEPVAALGYRHGAHQPDRGLFDVEATLVAGVDSDALRDALAFVGSNATTGDRLRTTLPPALLTRLVPEASRVGTDETWPWMLRLIDLPAAIDHRGWPDGVRLKVDLHVEAPSHVPDDPTAGRWRLALDNGHATVERGGNSEIAVRATDLAAIYSGHLDPAVLVSEGRLTGATPSQLSSLRAVFAGSPTLPTFF